MGRKPRVALYGAEPKNVSRDTWPEIGTSGLKRSGGLVTEEFLPELRGPRAMRVYREMRDNSAVVGACLGAIEMLIRQTKGSFTQSLANTAPGP